MDFSRRDVLAMGAGAAAFTVMPALPASAAVDDAIAEFTGGAEVTEGGINLVTPEIAENGNTVPVEVGAEGAAAIMLLAAGNPLPGVVTFNFGPLAASSYGATRIRLAGTQDVVAIARMADGSFRRTQAEVKVTIGGCGG